MIAKHRESKYHRASANSPTALAIGIISQARGRVNSTTNEPLFRGLKLIGYQDYCSFECGCRGNREEEIPKSMAFLRECWVKA